MNKQNEQIARMMKVKYQKLVSLSKGEVSTSDAGFPISKVFEPFTEQECAVILNPTPPEEGDLYQPAHDGLVEYMMYFLSAEEEDSFVQQYLTLAMRIVDAFHSKFGPLPAVRFPKDTGDVTRYEEAMRTRGYFITDSRQPELQVRILWWLQLQEDPAFKKEVNPVEMSDRVFRQNIGFGWLVKALGNAVEDKFSRASGIVETKNNPLVGYMPFTRAECAQFNTPFFDLGLSLREAAFREQQPHLWDMFDIEEETEYLRPPFKHLLLQAVCAVYEMFTLKYGTIPLIDANSCSAARSEFPVLSVNLSEMPNLPEPFLLYYLTIKVGLYTGRRNANKSINDDTFLREVFGVHIARLVTLVLALVNAVKARPESAGVSQANTENAHTPQQ